MSRSQVDVKALNIHLQVDVKLNELAKQILMLLPLLLHWLYFFILGGPGLRGPGRHPKNEKKNRKPKRGGSKVKDERGVVCGCRVLSGHRATRIKAHQGVEFSHSFSSFSHPFLEFSYSLKL